VLVVPMVIALVVIVPVIVALLMAMVLAAIMATTPLVIVVGAGSERQAQRRHQQQAEDAIHEISPCVTRTCPD